MVLSIIIPVYNEEKTIWKVLKEIQELNIEKQVILINDGSTDKSEQEIQKSLLQFPNIQLVKYKGNRGKGYAVKKGLEIAHGEYTIIQDADNEYQVMDIKNLFDIALSNDLKAVYGKRQIHIKTPQLSYFTSLFGTKICFLPLIFLLTSKKIPDMTTCYKLINTKLIKSFDLKSDGFEICAEITMKLIRMNTPIKFVPISYSPRRQSEGKKLRPIRDGIKMIYAILKYSR